MKTTAYSLNQEKDTIHLGKKLARCLSPGDIICLFGDLGSGKTTFTKGIACGLKIKNEEIHSPTFILLRIHKGAKPLYHFDLYRMEKREELLQIGYEEFLFADGISVIEWADKMGSWLPEEYLGVYLSFTKDRKRWLRFKPQGGRAKRIMEKMKA